MSTLSPFAELLTDARTAQYKYATYTQDQVDAIVAAVASAASDAAIYLAQRATEETGRGVMEDKVTKNRFAAETVHHAIRETKTCGVIAEDSIAGTQQIAAPMGVIAAVTPVTNPSSTIIYKTLLALKTRNALVVAPHPGSASVADFTTTLLNAAAVSAGAPEGLVSCLQNPTPETTAALMRAADLVLATGGPSMVRAAYSSGTPSIGVGPGNTPAIIDETADLDRAVQSIVVSKCFDHGMVCASEQTIIVLDKVYDTVRDKFLAAGAALVDRDQLRSAMFPLDALNAAFVGQSARHIATAAGVFVPLGTKLLLVEASSTDDSMCREKLSPVLALLRAPSFETALSFAKTLLYREGTGHTAVLHTHPTKNPDRIRAFAEMIPAARLLINQPATHGAIGDLYNFGVPPALTLGCGSWGGNSVAGQIGVHHLLNIKTVAQREENALWLKLPDAVFFGHHCLREAFRDLPFADRAVLVTDQYLHQHGICDPVIAALRQRGTQVTVFDQVTPDPTTDVIDRGADVLHAVKPTLIVAVGGGSPIDAAKLMQVRYEWPTVPFSHLSQRFADIRKRIHKLPTPRSKLVAIPTTSGTGSEVTPFAVVTDSATGRKYPLADYAMSPHMAIIDSALVESLPRALIAAGGIDAVVHALEAYVSVFATEFTDAHALSALRMLYTHLLPSYRGDLGSRKAVHRAASLAGMAFANAFLGVCHAMAHALGAHFHIPHGIANALLIQEVVRYNAELAPHRITAFSQYAAPDSHRRYTAIASALGLCAPHASSGVGVVIDWLHGLKVGMNIPTTIQDYGITEDRFLAQVDQIALEAFDDQCIGANPRAPLVSEIKDMLLRAYYGVTYPQGLPE